MKTHGKSNIKLYRVWTGMKQRCYNTNDDFYYCYGGKGITVCTEWKDSFQNFYEWAISNGYNENLTIDRIDSNKNYCPENCRWANISTQNRNRTDRKRYDYKGEKLLLSEISEITGIKLSTLWKRLQRGIALDKPVQTDNKKMVLIDNKVLYDSVTSAANSINATLSNVVLVCKGKRKTVNGHTAKYVEAAEARLKEIKENNND